MNRTRVIAPVIYGVIVAVTRGPVAIVAVVDALLLGLVHVLPGATGRTPRAGH